MPPAFSAKKIGGVPAYKLARAGQDVELRPKRVKIYELEILTTTPALRVKTLRATPSPAKGITYMRVRCSPGTYVRSIVRDIASALSTIATCSMIRRTKTNGFDIKDAVKLDFLENMYNNGGATKDWLLPLDLGLDDIPVAGLEMKDAELFANGGFVSKQNHDGLVRVYSEDRFIGIGITENGVLKPKRIIK